MSLLRANAAASLAALALASPAGAASVPAGQVVQAGPVLAGESFVYAVRSDEAGVGPGTLVRRVPLAGGTAEELARHFPRTAEAVAEAESLSASVDGFAVGILTTGVPDEAGLRAIGAAFGSPARELGACRYGAGVAVDAARAVVGCDPIQRADLTAGGAVAALPSTQSTMPRLAGSITAWIEGGVRPRRIVVFDLAANRVLRTFRVSRVSGRLDDFDVRADGSLALAYGSRRRDGSWVGTVSPSGRLSRLSVRRAATIAVRYRGPRVAALRAPLSGRRAIVLAQHGRSTRTLARRVAGDDHAAFDFDGRRLAWRTGSGSATRLHSRTLP